MATAAASLPGAVTVDANVVIALAAREAGRDTLAAAELAHYADLGYEWFAPGVIISEALYVLCGKREAGLFSDADYATAIRAFDRTMASILPPPPGDRALIERAAEIGQGYGCSHSADGLYLALAEHLGQTRPAILLTFDKGLARQAAKNAPTVIVRLLTL